MKFFLFEINGQADHFPIGSNGYTYNILEHFQIDMKSFGNAPSKYTSAQILIILKDALVFALRVDSFRCEFTRTTKKTIISTAVIGESTEVSCMHLYMFLDF